MKYFSGIKPSIGFILFMTVVMTGFSAGYVKAKQFNPPGFDPTNFPNSPNIDNPFLTFIPETAFCYEGETEDGTELDEVTVTDCDIPIRGVHTIVVRDAVWLDDGEDVQLTEDTYDIYAQDNDGNVWYLGEASEECDSGDTAGSWNADEEDAEPGIVMLNEEDLMPGNSYPQEYLEGVAEDMAKVQRLNADVTDYCDKDCLRTKEWSPLEPGEIEHKYNARDIVPDTDIGGLVLVEELKGKTVKSELVDVVMADVDTGYCPSDYPDALDNLCGDNDNPPPENCSNAE